MKKIRFQYHKTPKDITNREAIVLSKPSKNYFTMDITELNDDELSQLEAGLAEYQEEIDKIFAKRTKWIRDNGFDSYFRSFSQTKMNMAV